MDRGPNSDVLFLPDEKFDFDVSLSPASSTGDTDEDEVFVGPVGHRERCISVNIASRIEKQTSWSPLSGDALDAICEEAHKLANQLQSSEPKNEFVQDSETKLNMLCDPPPTVLSPIKRQTFCVQDSPLKQLPPAIQSRLLKARSPKLSGVRTTVKPQPNQRKSTRLSTSKSTTSPITAAKTHQAKHALRGKTGIGVGVVLPSRPTAPTVTRLSTRSQTDKSRLQPPSKLSSSWRRSPNSSRTGSCEDLLSDSASVASDVSDSSLNSSQLGRRTLAPPAKTLRTRPGVKSPGSESGRCVTNRRNTSSSSSSMSSFNSSFSLSPAAKGKLNSSLNQSLTSGPNSVSKPTNQKHRRSLACKPSDPCLSRGGRRSLSVQNQKPSQADLPRLKRPCASPQQNTPAKRTVERTSSVPTSASVRVQSGLKTKPKAQALVPPTPNGTLRAIPRFRKPLTPPSADSSSPDTTKILKPKRLISVKSVDSLGQLPRKQSLSALTPSGGSCSALQLKPRRPSALPTPLRSRLPQATPTSQSRPIRPLPNHSCAPFSLTPTEDPPAESTEMPPIQPFNLEEEEPVQAPPPKELPNQSENSAPVAICLSQLETRKEMEQQLTVESISKTQEVLLLDLPAPALQPQEKLLIDLTNTPDLIRTKTCPSASELIDLSSPLIKWSPVNKKEKDAPLINLSF